MTFIGYKQTDKQSIIYNNNDDNNNVYICRLNDWKDFMLSQSSKSISEKEEEHSGKQEYKKEIQNLREGKKIILNKFSKKDL